MDRGLVREGAASVRRTAGVPQAPASSQPRQRLRGVDAARAIAVLGMVMVHAGDWSSGERCCFRWDCGCRDSTTELS
jgi:uncharacterized membrane protein